MKKILLPGLLVFALVLSACERQSSVNSPVASDNGVSLTKTADQMNLSFEQMQQIDLMYYLGENLNTLLTPQQLTLLNTLSVQSGDVDLLADPGDRIPRGALDMEAMLIYRLILQANPDMTDEEKAALKAAIDESNKARIAIMRDTNTDPETKKQLLADEHAKLMILLFGENGDGGLIKPDQVQKYQELRARLEQERKDREAKMIEARIDRQVQMWTKLLTLNEGQQLKIKEILTNQAAEIARLREEFKGQPDALRQALKDLQKTTNDLIYAELDETQKAIWDKMHGKRGDGGTGGTTGLDREVQYWTKVLGLSTEQAEGLKTILTDQQKRTQEAMGTLRNDPAALKEALNQIKTDTDAALQKLLTQEQWDKWVKMHQIGPGKGGRG
jgi:hypothetical protein